MKKTLIIAEAGVNHNGDINIAKELVRTAKACGADIVKFQTAKLSSLVTKTADMAEYQKENIGKTTSQKEMLSKLLLSYDEFVELAAYCKDVGIQFLSTPFDLDSIAFLHDLGCEIWKIPSGEITNYPYLVAIAKLHQPVILSTGMSTMDEVRVAMKVLQEHGAGEITLLHCTTQYPTPYEDVNLKAMLTLQKEFGCKVGYSDHTRGIEVPVAAVAMGACVIEKHFTLDKNMEGPDHKASLEPAELLAMVESIRHIEIALGDGVKQPVAVEVENQKVVRKSIVAARDIKAGEVLTEENLTTKRPGTGINPMRWEEVLGTKAIRDFGEDELIEV
jgi:N,N'-diacetyllegionaminate synthase